VTHYPPGVTGSEPQISGEEHHLDCECHTDHTAYVRDVLGVEPECNCDGLNEADEADDVNRRLAARKEGDDY
jgi:hypothetical protein